MKLYRYHEDFGRMGCLDGVFIADDADLSWFMGADVWVDDVLGKHSEIRVSFNESTVTELGVGEQTAHELFNAIGKDISGMTPYSVDYLIHEYRESREEGEEE